MPSKLRKALGAVKDQTSISLVRVGVADVATLNLEVAILKATSHDEVPLDDHYVSEILQLIASNKFYAATCAHAIARRVGKTRNWIVALKSLMLILRIFQEGDPHFPRDVLHIMKRGGKVLNLGTFRDHSKRKNPWDYTAYVRTFALYLDERLDCMIRGKIAVRRRGNNNNPMSHRKTNELVVRDMKPELLLERIAYWQRLMDRAVSTKPTRAAKNNNLVQISMYWVVQESFVLYQDMSDALAVLLDSFFNLPYESGVYAFQTSVRASKQFEELTSYYAFCREMGVGKMSEYPSVQKIPDELLHTLSEFLMDRSTSSQHVPMPPPIITSRGYDISESIGEHMDVISEMSYDVGSQCTSLEDLISVTEGTAPSRDGYFAEPQNSSSNDDEENSSSGTSSGSDPTINFASLYEWQLEAEPNPFDNYGSEVWELELAKKVDSTGLGTTSDRTGSNNPFLSEPNTLTGAPAVASTSRSQPCFGSTDLFDAASTFHAGSAPPTFHAESSGGKATWMEDENDPFSSNFNPRGGEEGTSDGSRKDQTDLQHEQEMWLQHQNKIITKHIA